MKLYSDHEIAHVRHNGEFTFIRMVAKIVGVALGLSLLSAAAFAQEEIVYKAPSTAYAEEFCATYVPQGSTVYIRCLDGLAEGITGDMLGALVSSDGGGFIPDAYPGLVKIAPESEGRYVFTTSFYSEYLGSDGGIYHDRPVVQPELAVALPHGFYLNPWASRSNGAIQSNFGNEFDLFFGKGGDHYDVGIGYFSIVNLVPSDMVEFYANFSTPIGKSALSLHAGVEYYVAVHGDDPASGTITRLGVSHAWSGEKWSTETSLGVFYDTGAFGYAEGTLAEGQLSLMRQFSHGFSIGPQVKCAAPISLSFEDGRTQKCVVGLITSKSF